MELDACDDSSSRTSEQDGPPQGTRQECFPAIERRKSIRRPANLRGLAISGEVHKTDHSLETRSTELLRRRLSNRYITPFAVVIAGLGSVSMIFCGGAGTSPVAPLASPTPLASPGAAPTPAATPSPEQSSPPGPAPAPHPPPTPMPVPSQTPMPDPDPTPAPSPTPGQPPTVGLSGGGSCHPNCTRAFSANASGTAPLNYSWDGCCSGSSGTSGTCTINGVQTFTCGVTVSNPYGSAYTSRTAEGINHPPSVTGGMVVELGGTQDYAFQATGYFNDPDGDPVHCNWGGSCSISECSGGGTSSGSQTCKVTGPVAGSCEESLYCTDNWGGSGSTTWTYYH